ncbi:PCNA-interacting partner [Discoglossus pictus]
MACYQQNVMDMIKCFRRQWTVESERTTVCGADNMLLILQLALAEVNKKNGNEFSASLSDVLQMWRHLLKDKLGLPCEGSQYLQNYVEVKKSYDLFLKNSNSLDIIDLHERFRTHADEINCLSSEHLLEFLDGGLHGSEEDPNFPPISTPSKNNLDNVKVKNVLKRIFCAYLSILVNSKNDFALVQILNCPDRGLGRDAFTDLKHASKNKQMSIFLVATSFIRIIELGGKGYAPPESDPLRKHLKGLSQFVHFIDRLDEILGETQDPRTAGGLILSTIKMHLIKGRGSGDPVSEAAADVAQDLDLRIKTNINFLTETRSGSTTGISPARPKIHAINRGTALCGRGTMKAFLMLLDEEAANLPSKNKAELLCADDDNALFGDLSLLTLFRSPDQCNGSSPKPLGDRVQKCINKNKPKLKQNLIRSQFACTYKDGYATKAKECDFPSMSQFPTCIHPAPKIIPVLCFDDEPIIDNLVTPKERLKSSSGNIAIKGVMGKSCKNLGGGRTKRKQVDLGIENLNEVQSEPPQKKSTVEHTSLKKAMETKAKPATSKTKSKTAPKNKLLVGQAKLTTFFRM